MRPTRYFLAAGLASALACCKSPGAQYRFSAGQLAWQPYQEGQVLRFGNSRTSRVRIYRVMQVQDELEVYDGFYVGLFQERPEYQHLLVTVGPTYRHDS